MRFLQRSDTGEFSLTKNYVCDETIPSYAILSHTWGADTEEVTFDDITNGTGKDKPGYEKIRFCGEQAKKDNLQYFWIDTCCIDKANKAELSQAINSMFCWYRSATRCYVYLSDVSSPFNSYPESNPQPSEPDSGKNKWFIWAWTLLAWTLLVRWYIYPSGVSKPTDSHSESNQQQLGLILRKSKWFTRGWTLQELLAPNSVEFFSRERKRLGNKSSLTRQIHEITNIPELALQGTPLSQFSINERLSWIEQRHTKLEEDKAYSLLGIFDVYIPPLYGEGIARAFKRLMDEIDKLERCLQDLRLTDPRDDKKRIEETKGGLLEDSYYWILKNPDFQQWRHDPQSRLLWIKGDPGKGKTMLLCGIVNELKKSIHKTNILSYFFCQATNSQINNAIAVLRGLLYLLIDQQPSLVSHMQKKHNHAGKALFEDTNAWAALSEIFTNILHDPNLNNSYLIVDALDECVTDLPKLLAFIVQNSCISSRVKWIVSSRNWPSIEKDLDPVIQKVRLCLELNENSISDAVATYIQSKVNWLAKRNNYTTDIRDAVQRYLLINANDTFLWVALVCHEMSNISSWKAQQKLTAFPPGLDGLYRQMLDQIRDSEDADFCKRILAVVSTVYRPIILDELACFSDMPDGVAGEHEALSEIIKLCGSFLTLRGLTVSFVHQSAKDFLLEKASNEIFPSDKEETHREIFSRSVKVMSKTLRRDIYRLGSLSYPIKRVKQPDPDPLAALQYSSIHWVDHLHDWKSGSANYEIDSQDKDIIESFMRKKYLYWLEALSLYRGMSEGVNLMTKLEALLQERAGASSLLELVRDARRFIMYHKQVIESSPLQAYASALLFSPARSLIRDLFKHEELKELTIEPTIGDAWGACLQTLEGHKSTVLSVAFSHNSTRLASASDDKTVKIWDASGRCLQTLEGHGGKVWSVAFSHDSTWLASASEDKTVKIWDANGTCLQTLEGHSGWVRSVAFSHDSTWLASASDDNTVKIWDASGTCLQTLKGHRGTVLSVAFSYNSTRLASASKDRTIKIWDTSSGDCLHTLKGHTGWVRSVVLYDSARLASASTDNTVKIWDTSSGECLRTLKGHRGSVWSVTFSHDLTRLASGSDDKIVKIWSTSSGDCLQTLEGHVGRVLSVAFSHDSTQLASVSDDKMVKIWDASSAKSLRALEAHTDRVWSIAFSHDSRWLASGSDDKTVKIWDASSGKCLQTLEGHGGWVRLVVFSQDSTQLASASGDKTVKIWDISSGNCLQTLKGYKGWVRSVAFSHDSTRLASASTDKKVKIWDTSSGECLQTLDTGKVLFNLSFEATGSCLYTEIGAIVVGASLMSNTTTTVTEPPNPQYECGTLSSNGAWIRYNSENLVWLPSEYRPSCSVVSGKTIGIGVRSGKVWICNFKPDKS